MFRISKDSPALYLTSVTNHRLPVFRTAALKDLVCVALGEARQSAGLLLFAYVIMPDHLHAIIGSELKPSRVLGYINGISGRRVIDYLKEHNYKASLEKLRHAEQKRGYQYSLWEHHPKAMALTSENVFLQRVNYIHQNPVRAGLVDRAEDYLWSSVRCWNRSMLENEPLIMDLDKIAWRSCKA